MTHRYHAFVVFATVSIMTLGGCPDGSNPTTHADGGPPHGGSGGSHSAACQDSSDCPTPTDECHVATCGFDGSCSYDIPAPAGDTCGAEDVCDGSGNCVAAGISCQTNADCDDGDECTGDVCYDASKTCGHYEVPNCTPVECHTSVDCDDGNDCTNDVCYTFGGKCYHDPVKDEAPCAGGVCVSGVCK